MVVSAATKRRVTIPCTGAGLAGFHEWSINFPGPVTGNVIGLTPQMFRVFACTNDCCNAWF
ncbi:hypothetical protein Poly51_02390 [Rubripirellula tenax]|uniref:Uncharacterized protein n=1 Tax=Rubripirellula tenax TaxID=2528015 RepID=A0A5C6FDT0_9BACT|nr:hypothetical protein Poly51_02390 [Rubripirellula tenax]